MIENVTDNKQTITKQKLEKGEKEQDLLDPNYSFDENDIEKTMELNLGDLDE